MRNIVLNYIDRFRHDRRERLVLGFVLLILAVIVSLSVYWQLRYVGIALTDVTYCGYEEHVHTDECYDYVLTCGYEEGEPEITEGTHVHTDECYLNESVLVCGLEENEEHTHDESCYETQQVLICGYEEATAHVHTEECYELQLVCGLDEHTHTAECLIDLTADVEDSTVWEATLPVMTGNIRTNIVNIAYSQLGYTESTANYSIADDGVTHNGYTRYGAWYGNAYGSWDAMFAAFCLDYAGIDESEFPVNSGALAWSVQLRELGRYADAADYTPAAGDIVFFDSNSDGRIDRVGIVTAIDESAGMVTVIEGDYTAGDVDTVCEHIYPLSNATIIGYGIIPTEDETDTTTDETADETADSTEEATEDEDEVTLDEEEVTLDEEDSSEDTEGTSEEETSEEATESVFTASDSGVTVTVTAPAGALPENAVLSVSLLDEESEEYAAAAEAVGYDTTEETESAVNAISEDDEDDTEETEDEISTALAVLDISFTVDGVTVEPTEAVTVSIDASSLMTEDADASTLEVQHLEETAEGITPVLVADATDDTEGTVDAETAVAEFTVESFSSFALQWTYTRQQGPTTTTVTVEATVYVKDTDGNDISVSVDSVTLDAGTTQTLSTLLEIDGYTYDHADVTYDITSGWGWMQSTVTYTISNATSIVYAKADNYSNNYYYTVDSTRLDGDAENVIIYLYYAKSSASLTVNKYETDTTTQLSGATFTLTSDASLADVGIDGSCDSRSEYSITFTTTTTNITFSDLPDGEYTLTETSAPEGYDTAESFSFTVSGNTIESNDSRYSSGVVNIEDAPKTVNITLTKVYEDVSGNEITTSDSSAFTLSRISASSYSSEADQTVAFSGAGSDTLTCRYGSTYTLTESTAPDGYKDIGDITITVGTNGTITVSGDATYDSGTSTITVTNKALAAVTVSKAYKAADGSTKKTADVSDLTAEFTVTASDGTTYTNSITGKGTCTFSLPDGEYTITESTVPDGYFASDDVTFTITEGVVYVDGVATAQNTITFTNTEKTTLTITKVYVNASGSKVTTGIDDLEATFTITDGTNTYSGTITGAGELVFEGDEALADGIYTLSETAAGGYVAVDDVTVTISDGEISISEVDNVTLSDDTITVTNEPDDDHSLAGYTYAIVAFGNSYNSALSSSSYNSSNQGLAGVSITSKGTNSDGITLVCSASTDEVTMWTFVAASEAGVYYITDGNGHYLNITGNNNGGVSVSTTPVALNVDVNTDGTVMIYNSSGALNCYNSSRFDGWSYSTTDPNEQLTLCLLYEENGLTIIDNLVTDGEYEAHLVIDNVVVDLTDPKYTVTWYKSSYTLSANLSTCTNNEDYEEVTNSDALGDNNTTVNVAIDQGGLCYYYVTVEYFNDSGETVTLTSEVEHVPYAAELMNCSFEYKQSSTDVPFWGTTSYDGQIEIGAYSSSASNYGTQYIYAGGSQAAAGDYFAELNANYAGSLYQDVLTIGGEALNWAFYHRARTADGGSWQGTNTTDEMYVVIMSTEDAEKLLSGIDQSNQQSVLTAMIESILDGADEGSGDYTLVSGDYAGDTVTATIWTVSSTNSYQTGEWNYNSGSYTIPEGQYVTRFFFVSKKSGYSSTNYTVGNLIDYATFSQNVSYVIEYWTRDQNSGEYTLVKTTTDAAYPYTNVYADISTYTAAGYGLVGSVTGTASGGKYPADYNSGGTYSSSYTGMFDQYTTTGMRISSNTMYLSVYLSKPVVTVVKKVSGLSESELDEMLDEDDYEVEFTIYDSSGNVATTLTVHVGSAGVGSNYTTALATGETYTISEEVVYDGTFLDDYDMTVTVSGAETTNALGSYTFTVEEDTSITITFTNTYAEVTTGGPEMPQTGGKGTIMYTLGGILLLCSGGYLLYRKQKRKCGWRWNI